MQILRLFETESKQRSSSKVGFATMDLSGEAKGRAVQDRVNCRLSST